jgi:thiol-disulfide isomerase/thioredoxin
MVNSQNITEYNSFEDFEFLLKQDNDTLYVVNFWATWCKPCVMEMPYFQKVNEEYQGQKFRMILVNLDFGKDYKKRVKEFIVIRKLSPEVVILDDPDGNKWIPKVDSSWSGSIPATVIYGRDFRYFYQEMINYEILNNIVSKHIITD